MLSVLDRITNCFKYNFLNAESRMILNKSLNELHVLLIVDSKSLTHLHTQTHTHKPEAGNLNILGRT